MLSKPSGNPACNVFFFLVGDVTALPARASGGAGDGRLNAGRGLADRGDQGAGRTDDNGRSGWEDGDDRGGGRTDNDGRGGRIGGRRATGAEVEDGRTRDGIAGNSSVDVEDDAGVAVGVTGVDVEVLAGDDSARTGDLKLNAGRIELSTAGGVGVEGGIGLVESNDLLPDQILAGGKVGGNSESVLAVVGNDLVNSPLAVRKSILSNLGPNATNSVARGERSNVCNDGARVRTVDNVIVAGVVEPLKVDLGASRGLDERRSGLATVGTANKIGAGKVLDGAVVRRGADVDISAISLVDAINMNAKHNGMARDGASKS